MPSTTTARSAEVLPPTLNNLELLTLIGETAFGIFWQKPMAQQIGLSQRHMVRWCKGEWPVPDVLQDGRYLVLVLKDVLERHQTEIDKARQRVNSALPMGGRPGT